MEPCLKECTLNRLAGRPISVRRDRNQDRNSDFFRGTNLPESVGIQRTGDAGSRLKPRVRRGSDGDFVVIRPELVGFGLGDVDDDAVRESLDVVPLEEIGGVEFAAQFRHHVR